MPEARVRNEGLPVSDSAEVDQNTNRPVQPATPPDERADSTPQEAADPAHTEDPPARSRRKPGIVGKVGRVVLGVLVLSLCVLLAYAGGAGVVVFAVSILVTILVHEFAHLVTARRYGMYCSRFFAGVGPTLFSRTNKSGLEVGVKAFPLGGFVTIAGMTHEQVAKLPEERRDESYLAQRPRHRIIVTLAGPAVNVIIGMLVFVGTGLMWGLTTGQGTVTTVDDGSPAAQAGLVAGDEYTGRVLNENVLTLDIEGRGSVDVTLPEGASSLTVQEAGGFTVDQHTTRSPVELAQFTGRSTWLVASGTVKAIVNLPAAVFRAFDDDRQDAAMSIVGAARYAGDVYSDTTGGLRILLLLLASLNISIGVLNMIPILPFDGGHAGLSVLDAARARFAARRGKSSPPALDQTKFIQVTAVVVAIFIVTTIALVIADITNPIQVT